MITTKKIDKIEIINFSGDVYNLELESNEASSAKDDLFWIEPHSGIVTHNCFPKDICSLIYIAELVGIDPKVLSGVWNKNLEVRPERDWETLKGRAVSND